MNWNDLNSIFREQPLPPPPAMEDVKKMFEEDRQTRNRFRFRRDIAEILAGLLVFGFAVYFGWRMRVFLFVAAVSPILIPVTVFLRERIRAHHRRLNPNVSLLVRLESEIEDLRRRRKLALNQGWWAHTPCVVAHILLWSLVAYRIPYFFSILIEQPIGLCWMILFVVGPLFLYRWVRNRARSNVLRDVDPRLAQLEQLHRELTSGD